MPKTSLNITGTRIDITTVDNVILLQAFGPYTDEVALEVTQHIDSFVNQVPERPIRIWDARGIPDEEFLLSSDCVDKLVLWARDIQKRRPDAMAYLIGHSKISYGVGRMYAMRSHLEEEGIEVLRSLDDLPKEIREKLEL